MKRARHPQTATLPSALPTLMVIGLLVALVVTMAPTAPANASAPTGVGVEDDDTDGGAAQGGDTFTVMGRNLYLGADVGVALDLLPDFAAAAEFMWGQVAATDFDARAPKLAAEAHQYKPAVIGLQEATKWVCKKSALGGSTTIFDFTESFLKATEAAGTPYVIAESDGKQAFNTGYTIPAIPGLTTVEDPKIFGELFGQDSATCGFEMADALLVRADLADKVSAVGTSEFDDREVIVPVAFEIDRGYAWADIELGGSTVRVVTLHLESLWTPGTVTSGSLQANQLVADLSGTEIPLVVIGDFNNDYRDPRPKTAPNPGSQPEASEACPAQVANPTVETARSECNAYWIMRKAGFESVGPDDFASENFSWGSNALLAGPDIDRVEDALAQGNRYGFTDRLDYIFVKNGLSVVESQIIGNVWPDGPDVWKCDNPDQIENSEAVGKVNAEAGLTVPPTGTGICFPTDHAGIVSTLRVDEPAGATEAAPPPENNPFRLTTLQVIWLLIGIVVLIIVLFIVLFIWIIRSMLRLARRARDRDGDAGSGTGTDGGPAAGGGGAADRDGPSTT